MTSFSVKDLYLCNIRRFRNIQYVVCGWGFIIYRIARCLQSSARRLGLPTCPRGIENNIDQEGERESEGGKVRGKRECWCCEAKSEHSERGGEYEVRDPLSSSLTVESTWDPDGRARNTPSGWKKSKTPRITKSVIYKGNSWKEILWLRKIIETVGKKRCRQSRVKIRHILSDLHSARFRCSNVSSTK